MADEQQRDSKVKFNLVSEEEARRRRLEALREKGINPYPNSVERTHTIAEVLQHFDAWRGEEGDFILTGRIRLMRDMGRVTFAQIEDGTGRIQIFFQVNDLGKETYQTLKLLDIGDFVQVRGFLFVTTRGERTLHVREFRILAKGLRPLPEKYHGLEDIELRQRKRYLDLIANGDEAKQVFIIRSRTITAMRRYLDEHGFIEVETPILQPRYGGGFAEPFVTHSRELDADVYLRIADELYLKRLIVGGLEKVYELSKDFRNESISYKHSPEFTQVEWYEAYADYRDTMERCETLVEHAALATLGTTKTTFRGQDIDLAKPWARVKFVDALTEKGVWSRDENALRRLFDVQNVDHKQDKTWSQLVDHAYSHFVEPTLVQPTIVYDWPIELSPFARTTDDDDSIVERFECVVGGMEFANAFSEINDSLEQSVRFGFQAVQRVVGDTEAEPGDPDYVEAMSYGMAPNSGIGIGIDRLAMVLLGRDSIRDVILFPLLREKD